MTKEQLEQIIIEAAEKYYSGEEIMSDTEYDSLIEELRILDPTNRLIPGMASDEVSNAGYKKVPHKLTTGTLNKSATLEEFEHWASLHPSNSYHCSAKCDGQGFELQYEQGKLVHLVSRGNGHEGFDKIKLAQYLNIPKQINAGTVSIRGEFEMDNAAFEEFDIFKNKKNPRNASAGLLNKKFEEYTLEEIEALKRERFFAYDMKYEDESLNLTKEDIFNILKTYGFDIPEHITCHSIEEIKTFRNTLMEKRNKKELQYELDGIVCFQNDMDKQDQMELVQKRATAIKFDLMLGVSTIKDIEWSMAGAYLTPVAIIDPIELEGVTVTRANLCNLNIIKKLGIKIGDKVTVMRRGQVIPRIMSKYVED